jgi:Serine hydrolase
MQTVAQIVQVFRGARLPLPALLQRFIEITTCAAMKGFTNWRTSLEDLRREGVASALPAAAARRKIMTARHVLARRVVMLMIAATVLAGSPCNHATAKQVGKTGASPPYQVYLLKGLADVFSSGMDFLQAKLQARGIVGEVHSHNEWETLAQSAVAKWHGGAHGPIIIIGHSLGADAAILMAQKLGEAQVPVALLVAFSPVESGPANANVARGVTFFQSNSAWHGQITRGAGFHGVLETVDLAEAPGITHFNIEKSDKLHAATIAKVAALVPSSHTRAAAARESAPAPVVTTEP